MSYIRVRKVEFDGLRGSYSLGNYHTRLSRHIRRGTSNQVVRLVSQSHAMSGLTRCYKF